MAFKIVYNPEVQNDIQSAVDWYNKQQAGLGKRFLSAAKKHLNALKDNAKHYAIRYDDIHCMPIKKFPHMAHYRIDSKNKTIKVEAVFHTSRDPERWYQRTKQIIYIVDINSILLTFDDGTTVNQRVLADLYMRLIVLDFCKQN